MTCETLTPLLRPLYLKDNVLELKTISPMLAKGAKLVTGGEWDGNKCQPTLLTGVTEEMTVCKSETFGPVTSIYPINSYEEGLEKANDTEYGLSSAILLEI